MGIVVHMKDVKAQAWLRTSLASVYGPDFREQAKLALEQEVAFYKQMQKETNKH